MTKYQYLLRSFLRFYTSKKCPYCRTSSTKVVDRKFIVTTLNECSECGLFFRHPVDTVEFNRKFYQYEYEQNDGITTDLPSDTKLADLKANNFSGTSRDYKNKIEILKSILGGSSFEIIDYGANWGYISFQLIRAGFQVQSYEISLPRAKFGKNLGVEIFTDQNKLHGNVDIFFSSHVIEHLPDIKSMFLLAQKLLANDGYFMSYCPNGSIDFRRQNPMTFHRQWGQVHPNYLSPNFFSNVFRDVPYLIGSDHSKIEEIKRWDKNSQTILDTSGNELFVLAKIKPQRF